MRGHADGNGGATRALPSALAPLVGTLPLETLRAVAARAAAIGVAPHDELIASGIMTAQDYARACARRLGTGTASLVVGDGDVHPFGSRSPGDVAHLGLMATGRSDGILTMAMNCRSPHLPRLVSGLAHWPDSAGRVVLTTPQAFTDSIVHVGGAAMAREASASVAGAHPAFSARHGLAPPQRTALAAAALAVALGALLAPTTTVLALMVFFSLFFLSVSGIRLIAAATPAAPAPAPAPLSDADLPVYSVLVPLYREANMVPRVLAALEALDYPRAKLDAKLLVEVDDDATRRALAAAAIPPWCEVVTVARGSPRTKPRALSFALPLARGELITVYDAEDRPEPGQLRLAAAGFRDGPANLACLQGRLAWYNWNDNWLTRQFAIEYASLFDVLLPALDRLGLPFPLGGTSNHFRVSALRQAGGWDAYNVTEDADLGFRLYRLGFRCATLASSTYEEAPNAFGPWLRQRSRWLKGWMQTYAVHMRRPGALLADLGVRGTVVFQALVGGVVVSALLHPLFVAVIAGQVLRGDVLLGPDELTSLAVRGIGGLNLVVGYAAGFALGAVGVRRRPMRHLAWELAGLPVYWLAMSLAAYRALWQFVTDRWRWEKTTHGLDRTAAPPPLLAPRRRARRAVFG